MARLKQPINLRDLAEGGVIFEINPEDVLTDPSSDEESSDMIERKIQRCNAQCIGIFDEETYEDGEPFEIIAKKMFNLTLDGKIKKRILREGDGDKPEEFASVKVHYDAYLEYEEYPFDSTFVRNRPLKVTLNAGKILAGLDYSIQSMTFKEKSQFLIHPDYAYGKNCLIGRVPPNATILFEIELIDVVNSGATVIYESLSEDEQQIFENVYKYCMALCEKGKKLFTEHDYKNAIKEYNIAASKLERVFLKNKEEIEKHRELLMRLYTNLLICYTMISEARKGCFVSKKIYNLSENGELLKIPTKVYYNHAKCLRILNEYDQAKELLLKAQKREPKNSDINNEICNLENDKLDHRKKQLQFAKALVGK